MSILRGRKRVGPDDELRELRERGREALRKVKAVEAAVREGRATPEMLDEGTRAGKAGAAAMRELNERQRRRTAQAATAVAAKGRPPTVPLRFAYDVFPVELKGARLDGRGFSDEERRELHRVARARRDGPLSDKDRRSLGKLVDRAAEAAGNGPGFLARRRREIEAAEKQEAEARRLHLSMLPRRREPEPGSIEVPRAVFEAVTNGRDDTFDLTDAAVLVGLLFSFANESAALFARCRFDRVDGVSTLSITDAGMGVLLARGADDRRSVGRGRMEVASSLDTLRRNRWIETERNGKVLRVQPGARMRKLLGEAQS